MKSPDTAVALDGEELPHLSLLSSFDSFSDESDFLFLSDDLGEVLEERMIFSPLGFATRHVSL